MAEVLKDIPQSHHPDLLVGYNKADDAGVFRINENQALVQTLDFFPPIVDDPYSFGQIAAANALSDVYAMGGKPLTALNIVGFPSSDMPPEILTEILRGGNDIVEKAGAVVVGGHSIKDNELKYGISVTGIINPYKIITNTEAKVGDRLFLTKPLGTGLITTGIKKNIVNPELEKIVTVQMAQLNKKPSELMVEFDIKAATDITGYGLLGHAYEMAKASNITIRLFSKKLPLMPYAVELAEAGMIPGGALANREFLEGSVQISPDVDENIIVVMYDPQTSGGLFIAVPEAKVKDFASELESRKIFGQVVGIVERAGNTPIIVE